MFFLLLWYFVIHFYFVAANLAVALSIITSDESKTLELDAETPDLRNEWLAHFQLLIRQNADNRLTS